MKTLYVLRHGQAAPESEAQSDHERVLTARGKSEARLAAEHLAGRPQPPSLILSSSAARAKATAEACLVTLPNRTRLTILDELYLAEPPSYLAALAAGGDPHDAVLVVGHNPGLEALIYVLTQHSEHLATASLVEIEMPIAAWSDVLGAARVSGQGQGAVSGTKVDHFRVRG
jgi:phosphohistidine phosphatase